MSEVPVSVPPALELPLLSPDSGYDGVLGNLPGRVHAVLWGAALGDALGGAPGVFSDGDDHLGLANGDEGGADCALTSVLQTSEYTRLCLFTLDGLLEAVEWANAGQPAEETACLWLAYLRWLRGQDVAWPEAAPSPPSRWIDHCDISTGVTFAAQSLEALRTGAMGEVERPVLPQAMDVSAVVRSAAFGLLPVGWKALATMAINGAAITHGHSEVQVAAVAYALSIQATATAALRGVEQPVRAGLTSAVEILPELTRPAELTYRLLREVLESHDDQPAEWGQPSEKITGPVLLSMGAHAALRAERASAPEAAAARTAAAPSAATPSGTARSATAPSGTAPSAAGPSAAVPSGTARSVATVPAAVDQWRRAFALATGYPASTVQPACAPPATASQRTADATVPGDTAGPRAAASIAGALTGAALGGTGLQELGPAPDWMRRLDVAAVIERGASLWINELGLEGAPSPTGS